VAGRQESSSAMLNREPLTMTDQPIGNPHERFLIMPVFGNKIQVDRKIHDFFSVTSENWESAKTNSGCSVA